MALIAQAATLEARIPIVHFFDGFRTSHEVAKIQAIDTKIVRQMINQENVTAHRLRALSPERPVIRGTSQNPDVFFQARESVNPYYRDMPAIVQKLMDQFAALTGRAYHLFDYVGVDDAEKVIVLMGSGAETAEETVNYLNSQGEKTGLLKVRLFRPFDAKALINALPQTTSAIAVLDRTKEPGADGEPLYKDIVTALAQCCLEARSSDEQQRFSQLPVVIGGRYGLSSKEFTPAMVKAVFDELGPKDDGAQAKNHFTVGIIDDVTNSSLQWDENFRTDAHENTFQAIFYGWAAMARSVQTRTASRSSASPPTNMHRVISFTTLKNQARSPCHICALVINRFNRLILSKTVTRILLPVISRSFSNVIRYSIKRLTEPYSC